MISVHPATSADVDQLVEMFLMLTEHVSQISGDIYLTTIGPSDPGTHRTAFAESVESKNSVVLIAKSHKQPIGFLNGYLTRPFTPSISIQRIGYIENCYVKEPARSLGVGTRLLTAAEAWFKHQAVDYIDLHYMAKNAAAAHAWARMGFEPYRIAARKKIE